MKVTVENKKGLNKDLKIFIDKETMNSYMDEKYEEIKGTVNLKGFRPGKVPKEILKRQFGKAVFGEVLDKVLKDTSTKALEENKIKPAGQPKLDLKTYGEDKELEYVLSVTELPKVEIKSLENIKFDEYTVKIDDSETDKRIKEIAMAISFILLSVSLSSILTVYSSNLMFSNDLISTLGNSVTDNTYSNSLSSPYVFRSNFG